MRLIDSVCSRRLDQGSATESPANTRRQLWYSDSEARQAAASSLQEESHDKAADDSSSSGSDGNSTKRSLKRSNLSPSRGKRKSSGSDDIRVEGELVVSELQLHANDAKPTVRTLGLVSEWQGS